MPNDLDLDDRIRALVSSAVADAPTAPTIEQIQTQPVARKRPSWPKWTAVLAALLAAGGATVALQPADKGDVDTTQDTTAPTQFTPRDEPSVIVTAGLNGIHEMVDGVDRVVSHDKFTAALALDNDEVVALQSTYSAPGYFDNQPVRIAADGTVTPLFDHRETADFFMLHDFSVVDGRRLLLYSEKTNTGSTDGAKQTLFTLDLDTSQVTEIAQVGDAFSATDVLSLGSNGLIIGAKEASSTCGGCDVLTASLQPVVLAVPGSPAAARPLPKPANFGLQDSYAYDCTTCPWNYFTDATGTSVYWVSTLPDGTGTAVYSARIDRPGKAPTLVKDLSGFGRKVKETYPGIGRRGLIVNYGYYENGKATTRNVFLEGDTVVELGGYATVGWQG
jgi:hypothetical protein